MYRFKTILKAGLLVIAVSVFSNIHSVSAQDSDLGLCPENYSEGLVETGFVDCYERTSDDSDREDTEQDRIEAEAICNATPRAMVTSSQVFQTSSGRFFAEITCTVSRRLATGIIICPADSVEVFRAFDTLVCEYFGSAEESPALAQAALTMQTDKCVNDAGGRVLESSISMGTVLDDEPFYSTALSCAFDIISVDVFDCPPGFERDNNGSDETVLVCDRSDSPFETFAESEEVNMLAQSICMSTTAGLGEVSEASSTASTGDSNELFVSFVECTINIPRYGEFADDSVVRACDATCTEEVEQVRACLNGGVIGGPGCVESSTQLVVRRCNTGTMADSLCPLPIVPNVMLPILLSDEDEGS